MLKYISCVYVKWFWKTNRFIQKLTQILSMRITQKYRCLTCMNGTKIQDSRKKNKKTFKIVEQDLINIIQ